MQFNVCPALFMWQDSIESLDIRFTYQNVVEYVHKGVCVWHLLYYSSGFTKLMYLAQNASFAFSIKNSDSVQDTWRDKSARYRIWTH